MKKCLLVRPTWWKVSPTHFGHNFKIIRTNLSISNEPISVKVKTLLKERVNSYLDNNEYTLGAVEAVCTQGILPEKVVEKIEEVDKIQLPVLGESFGSPYGNWRFFWNRSTDDHSMHAFRPISSITSSVLFEKGYDALARYVYNEELDHSVMPAFAALERFFINKEKHEKSLRRLQAAEKLPETAVASLLAQHLLAQLLPRPSSYFLDILSPGKPDGCPCGCGKPIYFGCTQLGSPQLFYGRADIVLFPTSKDLFFNGDDSKSALFVLQKKRREVYDYRQIDYDWNGDSDIYYEDISTGECEINSIEGDDVLQLFRQAISTSLCKLIKNIEEESGTLRQSDRISMVPVCGVTENSFCVVAYDAENDYLLRMVDDMKIFDNNSVRFSTIFDLWLLINHSLFCTKPPPEVLEKLKGTCNLISQLGPERYASIVNNSKWLYQLEDVRRQLMPHPEASELFDLAAGIKKYPRIAQSRNLELKD